MQNTIDLNYNFKSKRIKEWFNDNYFLCVYDREDNYITSFERIEDTTKFFNLGLFQILQRIRNGQSLVYDNHLVKVYIFEKEKENDSGFVKRK